MLLYPLHEAVLLLSEKLAVAKRSLRHTKEDLEFLREQITVMEVNFARVHNVSLVNSSSDALVKGSLFFRSVGCQEVTPAESKPLMQGLTCDFPLNRRREAK